MTRQVFCAVMRLLALSSPEPGPVLFCVVQGRHITLGSDTWVLGCLFAKPCSGSKSPSLVGPDWREQMALGT